MKGNPGSGKYINLHRLYRLLSQRDGGVAEHGQRLWLRMLQRELTKLDRELKPKQDRVYLLVPARNALLAEIAAVSNMREAGNAPDR